MFNVMEPIYFISQCLIYINDYSFYEVRSLNKETIFSRNYDSNHEEKVVVENIFSKMIERKKTELSGEEEIYSDLMNQIKQNTVFNEYQIIDKDIDRITTDTIFNIDLKVLKVRDRKNELHSKDQEYIIEL